LAFEEGKEKEVSFRVYNPSKTNKFGIKIYKCSESSSGYIVSFDVYQGTPGCAMYTEIADIDLEACQTTKIVIGLLGISSLLDKSHKVFLDNYS